MSFGETAREIYPSPFGEEIQWQAHHVIPNNLDDGDYGEWLEGIGFDIQDASQNALPLPSGDAAAEAFGAAAHRGSHPKYEQLVAESLKDIKDNTSNDTEALRKVNSLVTELKIGLAPGFDQVTGTYDRSADSGPPKILLHSTDIQARNIIADDVKPADIDQYNRDNIEPILKKIGINVSRKGLPGEYEQDSAGNRVLNFDEPERVSLAKGLDLDKTHGAVGIAANTLAASAGLKIASDFLSQRGLVSGFDEAKSLLLSSNVDFAAILSSEGLRDATVEVLVDVLTKFLSGPLGIIRGGWEAYQSFQAIDGALEIASVAWPENPVFGVLVEKIDAAQDFLADFLGRDGELEQERLPQEVEVSDHNQQVVHQLREEEKLYLEVLDAPVPRVSITPVSIELPTISLNSATANAPIDNNLMFLAEFAGSIATTVTFEYSAYGVSSDGGSHLIARSLIEIQPGSTGVVPIFIDPRGYEDVRLEVFNVQGAVVADPSSLTAYGIVFDPQTDVPDTVNEVSEETPEVVQTPTDETIVGSNLTGVWINAPSGIAPGSEFSVQYGLSDNGSLEENAGAYAEIYLTRASDPEYHRTLETFEHGDFDRFSERSYDREVSIPHLAEADDWVIGIEVSSRSLSHDVIKTDNTAQREIEISTAYRDLTDIAVAGQDFDPDKLEANNGDNDFVRVWFEDDDHSTLAPNEYIGISVSARTGNRYTSDQTVLIKYSASGELSENDPTIGRATFSFDGSNSDITKTVPVRLPYEAETEGSVGTVFLYLPPSIDVPEPIAVPKEFVTVATEADLDSRADVRLFNTDFEISTVSDGQVRIGFSTQLVNVDASDDYIQQHSLHDFEIHIQFELDDGTIVSQSRFNMPNLAAGDFRTMETYDLFPAEYLGQINNLRLALVRVGEEELTSVSSPQLLDESGPDPLTTFEGDLYIEVAKQDAELKSVTRDLTDRIADQVTYILDSEWHHEDDHEAATLGGYYHRPTNETFETMTALQIAYDAVLFDPGRIVTATLDVQTYGQNYLDFDGGIIAEISDGLWTKFQTDDKIPNGTQIELIDGFSPGSMISFDILEAAQRHYKEDFGLQAIYFRAETQNSLAQHQIGTINAVYESQRPDITIEYYDKEDLQHVINPEYIAHVADTSVWKTGSDDVLHARWLSDNSLHYDGLIFSIDQGYGPDFGEVVVNDDGTFQYTPASDFEGIDTFQVKIEANGLPPAFAEITLHVGFEEEPINEPAAVTLSPVLLSPTIVDGDGTPPDTAQSWQWWQERFWGTDHDDIIDGGTGDDAFVATGGDDHYFGGAGSNQYSIHSGVITITDVSWSYDAQTDVLRGTHEFLGTDYFDGAIGAFWNSTPTADGNYWFSRETVIGLTDGASFSYNFTLTDDAQDESAVTTFHDGDGSLSDPDQTWQWWDERFEGVAFAGDEIINAGAGDDDIVASTGNDIVYGGAGYNQITIIGDIADFQFSIDPNSKLLASTHDSFGYDQYADDVAFWFEVGGWKGYDEILGLADSTATTFNDGEGSPADPEQTWQWWDERFEGAAFAGDEFIFAGSGDDDIVASTGNDVIDGGDGYNQLTALADIDEFVFSIDEDTGNLASTHAVYGYDQYAPGIDFWFETGGWFGYDEVFALA